MREWIVLVVVGAMAGCSSGSVDWKGGDKFGKVASVTWLDVTSTYDGDSERDHAFIMSNKGGLCGDYDKALEELAEVSKRYYTEYYENYYYDYESTEYCLWYRDILADYGNALDRVIGGGARILSLDLGYGSDGTPPGSGTYVNQDDVEFDEYGYPSTDDVFYAWMYFAGGNRYLWYADQLDCDNPDWYDYDYDEAEYDDLETSYDINGGSLAVTASDSSYTLELTGASVEDEDGGSAGTVDVKGKFKHCPITVDGYAYLF